MDLAFWQSLGGDASGDILEQKFLKAQQLASLELLYLVV